MLIQILHDVPQESSFADTSFSHDHDRNVLPHSLSYQTHLEEVIQVDHVTRFDVDIVSLMPRNIFQNILNSLSKDLYVGLLEIG